MDDDYISPLPGKTYISPSLTAFGDKTRRIRIASRILPSKNGYEYANERDEVVLRKKPDAATYIKVKFLEDTRETLVLTVQNFSSETGQPYGSGFSFVGEEIGKFCEFLANIHSVDFKNRAKVNITDDELRKIALTSHQAKAFLIENQDLFIEAIRSEITTQDIIAVGYRKKQLDIYDRLLSDPVYFEILKEKKECSNEALWQKYFEKNQWVFGYGLGYIFLSSLDDKKLEQVVQGYSVNSHGKRVDALMKTREIISNICFVEIKTHLTELLEGSPYRSGCWAPSKELAGAIAQVQGTVASAIENLEIKVNPNDNDGNPTGEEIYNIQPKSYLVIGSMDQIVTENGVNRDKLRSFEFFRKNTLNPEIITFDELHERAKFIVNHNQS